jgi:membrane-bound lytic murein transglycosylase A
MGRSLTALRSIAVDPGHVPMGAPVWVEKDGAEPLRRLMIAQDTGTAIKGPGRGDIFYGSGPEAGRSAARVKDRGRMVVLVPRRPGG